MIGGYFYGDKLKFSRQNVRIWVKSDPLEALKSTLVQNINFNGQKISSGPFSTVSDRYASVRSTHTYIISLIDAT